MTSGMATIRGVGFLTRNAEIILIAVVSECLTLGGFRPLRFD